MQKIKYKPIQNENHVFQDHDKTPTSNTKHVIYVILLLFLSMIMGWIVYVSGHHYMTVVENYQLRRQFDEYIVRFNKSYRRDSGEYKVRLNFFKDSLKEIDRLNRESAGPEALRASYRLNAYSDQHPREFAMRYLTARPSPERSSNLTELPNICDTTPGPLTEKFDWRDRGAVGPVLTQGTCGACWAFSAVGVIESHISIMTNATPPSLSIQQVIDCIREGNDGCVGGSPAEAMSVMFRNRVVMMSAAYYPLTLLTEECRGVSPEDGYMLNNLDLRGICVGREEEMAKRVAKYGPIAVSLNAATWQHYNDGIIQNNCGGKSIKEINHAVQIVGYDTSGQVPYYIVKNSWGENWNSLRGYAYVAMYQNECGIAWQATQPQSICWASADRVCL